MLDLMLDHLDAGQALALQLKKLIDMPANYSRSIHGIK
jgi:hypothetical protein